MTKPLDYFKDHPASPDASEKPLAWKYGYLIGIIRGAMYLNNKQEIKNALMEALDYLERHEGSTTRRNRRATIRNPSTSQRLWREYAPR